MAFAAVLAAAGTSMAPATTLFTENFGAYSGNQNAFQDVTGDPVAYGGTVPGWTGAGGNALHAVNSAQFGWTIMLYFDNTITLNSGIAANQPGQEYAVDFQYGSANYAPGGQGTPSDSGVTLELLRNDNSVLAQQTFFPGAWGSGNYDLQQGLAGSLVYTGDGTGNIRLTFFNTGGHEGAFGSSIDNISLSATPEPGGLFLAGPALAGLVLLKIRRRA